jgi:hypothetical protein
MSFFNFHRRGIALFAVIAFFSLIPVASLPADAVAGDSGAPQAFEKEAPAASVAQPGKRSILPLILGVAAAGVVAAVLILVVFKTKYDITGNWTIYYTMPGYPDEIIPTVFTGDRKSGTATTENGTGPEGTYTVDGKKATILLHHGNGTWEFIGEFRNKDRIEGDLKYYSNNVHQAKYDTTFYAERD